MMDLTRSAVRTETGALQIVHHATRDWGFAPSDMSVLSHFGTRMAARERVLEWPQTRLISALLDIRAPAYLPDINGTHEALPFARLVLSQKSVAAALPEDFLARVTRAEDEAGEGMEEIVAHLRMAGYDGIGYRNHHEDPGSMSWVIFDPRQIHVLRDGMASASLEPWEHDEDSFLGPVWVGEEHEISGRSDDYVHVWEALRRQGARAPDLTRDSDGWSARWLSDWEPHPALGLFDPQGIARGFYLQGICWIDPDARGHGRSRLMIEAAADLVGGPPVGVHDGLGMSAAGYQCHLSALRDIKRCAAQAGYESVEYLSEFGS